MKDKDRVYWVEATHTFKPKGTKQLPFKKGDLLMVLIKKPNGWWVATFADDVGGQIGLIPSNFVKEATHKVDQTPTKQIGRGATVSDEDLRMLQQKAILKSAQEQAREIAAGAEWNLKKSEHRRKLRADLAEMKDYGRKRDDELREDREKGDRSLKKAMKSSVSETGAELDRMEKFYKDSGQRVAKVEKEIEKFNAQEAEEAARLATEKRTQKEELALQEKRLAKEERRKQREERETMYQEMASGKTVATLTLEDSDADSDEEPDDIPSGMYRAVHNFKAEKATQLSFSKGDMLFVSKKPNPGWWVARPVYAFEDPSQEPPSGFVPSNYLKGPIDQ